MLKGSVRKSLIALGALGLFAPAQAADPAAPAGNLKGNAVVLRTLDKVTATTEDYTVRIGDELKYGSLTVVVKHCEKKPPEDVPETYAFLQIDDLKLDGKGDAGEQERVFSGWMMASNPAISALDHSVYDIWVIDCKVPAVQGLR